MATDSEIVMFKSRPEYERVNFDYPVVKLCDFGASKRQGERLHASTVDYDSPVGFIFLTLEMKLQKLKIA